MFIIFFGILSISAQKIIWQKDIPSTTQDFLSYLTTTIDQQILIGGSSINKFENKYFSYDYHLVKLDQQGQKVWERYFGGLQHDFLTTATATQEGGFLILGNSYSSKGNDKKENSIGGTDIWMIKLSENGEEEWQKTIGTDQDDEAKSVIQTSDLGYIIAGNIQNYSVGIGGKDILIIKLDKKGNLINQIILGGKELDEVEKIIPTKDGGALLAIYSRSGNDTEILTAKVEILKSFNKTILVENSDKNQNLKKNINLFPIDNLHIKDKENFGEGDYWIVKLDKSGNVEWQRSFGGYQDEHIKDISLTINGFIIAGESQSTHLGNKTTRQKEETYLWLISLDEFGNEL